MAQTCMVSNTPFNFFAVSPLLTLFQNVITCMVRYKSMDLLFLEWISEFQLHLSIGACGPSHRFDYKKTKTHQKSVDPTLASAFASLRMDSHILHSAAQGYNQ